MSQKAAVLERPSSAIMKSIMRQKDAYKKRLVMQNEKLAFVREREASRDIRHMVAQSSVDCRLNLQERRLDLKRGKRGGQIELDRLALQLAKEERRAMVGLLKIQADK